MGKVMDCNKKEGPVQIIILQGYLKIRVNWMSKTQKSLKMWWDSFKIIKLHHWKSSSFQRCWMRRQM